MTRVFLLLLALLSAAFITYATAQPKGAPQVPQRASAQGRIDFAGFQSLAREVHAYRANRLVTLAQSQVVELGFSNRGSYVNSIFFCVAFTAAAWAMVLYVIGAFVPHIMAFG